MKTINLEEILLLKLKESKYGYPTLDSDVHNNILSAMKEACRQVLYLTAKNIAESNNKDKEAIILNTINQVE